MKHYFSINDQPDCDPGILWEAHKTVIRGVLIRHSTRIKRERQKQLTILFNKIHVVELQHKQTPTHSLGNELLSLRQQIVDLLHYRAKAALQFCRKLSYESGNKCGKMLAKSVRDHKFNTYIPQIISPSGHKAALPNEIANKFRDFYSTLYNLPKGTSTLTALAECITLSQMPQIPADAGEEMEAPITVEELQRALGGMKPGKAPGPDGFTLHYYQSLLPNLGPYMVRMFNALSSDTNFPRDTLNAHITVLPKEGKDYLLW